MYRGRFAPSPTGDLHLGSAACALVAWLSARAAGGALVLRVEDLDTPRCVRGAEARQLADLQWLGLDWDEGPDRDGRFGPYRQSERLAYYDDALRELDRSGLTYLCDCSRAEIAQVASAPHGGDDAPRYPGTCRRFGMSSRGFKRPPAVRLAVPDRSVAALDGLQGRIEENVAATVGDFVLRRGDGIYAYQLAVVVDDLAMQITEVVRGADLLGSLARQTLLAELLGGRAPRFAHHALVVAPHGGRLSKRDGALSLAALRAAGVRSAEIVASLARALGLVGADDVALTPRDLLPRFDRPRLAGLTTAVMPPPSSSGRVEVRVAAGNDPQR